MSSMKAVTAVTAAALAAVARGGNFIYHVSEQTIGWEDANLFCKAKYGTLLASIHSLPENDRVYGLLEDFSAYQTGNHAWFGMNDIALEGEWLNIDGTARDYWRFYTNQPNNAGGNQHCGVFHGPGQSPASFWGDSECNYALMAFVCNAPSWITADTIASDTWILIPNEAKNFADADAFCAAQSGTTALASVPSQAVDDLMFAALQNRNAAAAWIGYWDPDTANTWQWSDGSAAGFTSWAGDEPKCATMSVALSGDWDYTPCSDVQPAFFCQLV